VRLFVALEIPSAVRDNLAALIKELRSLEPASSVKKVRWVRSENLHVTLKFIGETAPERLEAIGTALSTVRSPQPAELRFRGLGYFPNEKRARVLWVGIEAPPNLAAIAGDVDQHLETVGFPRESRPFTPHLTLARLEPPGIARVLHAAVLARMTREFGVLHTREFHLIESQLKPSGAEYTTLRSFPFAAEA
jgi:RNA 2',3'-cyclic 3'-phosphodiesterase